MSQKIKYIEHIHKIYGIILQNPLHLFTVAGPSPNVNILYIAWLSRFSCHMENATIFPESDPSHSIRIYHEKQEPKKKQSNV